MFEEGTSQDPEGPPGRSAPGASADSGADDVVGSAGATSEQRLYRAMERSAQLVAQISMIEAELVGVLSEVQDSAPLWDMTFREYVSWQLGLRTDETGRLLRLARRLPGLPELSGALASGALSAGVVDLLSRVCTPENEHVFLSTAQAATARQLETLIRIYSKTKVATDDSDDDGTGAGDDEQPDRLSMSRGEDGRLRGSFDLGPVLGSIVEKSIGAARDDCKTGEAEERDVEPQVTNAAAFGTIADSYLSGREQDRGARCGDRFKVILVAELEPGFDPAMHMRLLGPDGFLPARHMFAAGAGPVSRSDLEECACEGSVETIVYSFGEPFALEVPDRFAAQHQRDALIVRDRCCQYPGCGKTINLIAHHIIAWPDGPTHLHNLILLCRKHHRRVHRRNLSISMSGPRVWEFHTPEGIHIPRANPRPPPEPFERPDPPAERRQTGYGERLTPLATDVILNTWHQGRDWRVA